MSTNSKNQNADKGKTSQNKGKVRLSSRAEVQNADGSFSPVISPGSHKSYRIDPKTGKRYLSEGWVDPKKNAGFAGRHLRGLTSEQIISRLNGASAQETTLIIEELKSRRTKGVKALVHILKDDRKAVFDKNRQYWWYQQKGVEPDVIPLSMYAAFTLQFITNEYPSQVILNLTNDRLIYAVKGSHAVVKEDVVKVWSNWWQKAKNDY